MRWKALKIKRTRAENLLLQVAQKSRPVSWRQDAKLSPLSVYRKRLSTIALDPSINVTGYAIRLRNGRTVSGTIETAGGGITARLYSLRLQLRTVLEKYMPAQAAVEYPPKITYSRSTDAISGKALNIEDLIKLALATGVVLETCAEFGCQTDEVLATWKGIAGKGFTRIIAGKQDHNEADACLLLEWYLAGGCDSELIGGKTGWEGVTRP
jgi:Holliday junction resolvasome RuvABC endonuclease subunit